MEAKIALIDKICKLHPAYGVDKGWSEYVGGMTDTGEWFFRKMLDVPIEELQQFYDAQIAEQNKPLPKITKEEKRQSKNIIDLGGGRWTTELEANQLNKLAAKLNRNGVELLFGKRE